MTSTEEYSNGISYSEKMLQMVESSVVPPKKPEQKKKLPAKGKKRGQYRKCVDYSQNSESQNSKKKKEKVNVDDFDSNEDRALTITYLKYARMLKNPKVSKNQKDSMWGKILHAVNAQGPIHRNLACTKKRLQNIKAGG